MGDADSASRFVGGARIGNAIHHDRLQPGIGEQRLAGGAVVRDWRAEAAGLIRGVGPGERRRRGPEIVVVFADRGGDAVVGLGSRARSLRNWFPGWART